MDVMAMIYNYPNCLYLVLMAGGGGGGAQKLDSNCVDDRSAMNLPPTSQAFSNRQGWPDGHDTNPCHSEYKI